MKITNSEYSYFSELLAQKFEYGNYKKFDVPVDELEKILGQPFLIKTKAEGVDKINFKDLQDNQIVFLARPKKDAAFYLAKHFRNCASHGGRITKKKVGDSFIYLFEDVYANKATMRCKLSKETLILLINTLYNENKND